jgi:hypothetical protein
MIYLKKITSQMGFLKFLDTRTDSRKKAQYTKRPFDNIRRYIFLIKNAVDVSTIKTEATF